MVTEHRKSAVVTIGRSPSASSSSRSKRTSGTTKKSTSSALQQRGRNAPHGDDLIIMLPLTSISAIRTATPSKTTNKNKPNSNHAVLHHQHLLCWRSHRRAALGFLILLLVLLLSMKRSNLNNLLLASSYVSDYHYGSSSSSSSIYPPQHNDDNNTLEIWTRREAPPDPAVEDAYRGAFRFVDSTFCNSNSNRRPEDMRCTIYFPSYDSQYPTTCWNNNSSNNNNKNAAPSLCMMTLRGAKGHEAPNQDRSVVLVQQQQQQQQPSDPTSQNGDDYILLAALFDGHGDLGHVTSQIAINELVVHILDAAAAAQQQQQPYPPQQIFQSTYLATDRGRMSQIPRAGTTAVTVLQQGRQVHLASAGDSTAVLVQWFGDEPTMSRNHRKEKQSNREHSSNHPQRDPLPWYRQWLGRGPHDTTILASATTTATLPFKILARAVQHKPGDPMERARIEAAGGMVHIPFVAGQSSRVVYPIQDDESGLMMQMALAMSRSLGDKDGKELGVVIADPDVVTVDLNDYIVDGSERFFVVLASDGVIDMVPTDRVVASLGRALYDGGGDLHAAVQDILTLAVEKWRLETGDTYRDDISLTVQKIELPS